MSLGLVTGIAGSANGCSSHSTPPEGAGGSQNIGGAGGSENIGGAGGSQNIGGFCGNCMGQNGLGGAGGHPDAATEAGSDATDAQATDAETGGG